MKNDLFKQIEDLFVTYETKSKESKESQLEAKEAKDEIIELMKEAGKDEVTINGLDSIVKLMITYQEKEVLNKKELASALNVKQKDLTNPQIIIQLTQEGTLTSELIEKFTEPETKELFKTKEVQEEEEEEEE